MKLKLSKINEIIDGNGELIGADDMPSSGSDLDTAANNTTDYNASISHQPYRYSTLAMMGMSMPFYESKDNIGSIESPILKDIAKLLYDNYMSTLKHYYQNPNKLKSDYRVKSEETFDTQSEHGMQINMDLANEILKKIEPYFEKDKAKNIDESVVPVVEDKMVNKSEDEISVKGDDNGIKDKKLIKIAGLINKMSQTDINKIVNLLEKNNGKQ